MDNKKKFIFYIVVSLFWFSLYAYVPYVTPYADEMGTSLRLTGLIAGAYGFTQMLLRLPLGIFSDKLQRRKIFVQFGLLAAALSGVLVFFFPSPIMLLVARGLGGVAASVWVTLTVLGASYNKGNDTTRVMGQMSAANAFGRMVALLLGGLAAQVLGVPYAFLLGGIVGVIGLLFGFKLEDTPKDENRAPFCMKDFAAVIRDKQLIFCSVLGILSMYISFSTTFGFTPLAAARLNASGWQLGLLGVLSTAPAIFISPIAGGFLPKKIGSAATLSIGFIIAALGSLLVAFADALWVLFVVQISASLGVAIVSTLLLGLCIRDVPEKSRATAMGFFQAVYGIGMFMGPFVTGQISFRFGLSAAFVFTGLIGFCGFLLTLLFAKAAKWKHSR